MINYKDSVLLVHRYQSASEFLDRIQGSIPVFSLVVAYTDTVQIPGVSGAGSTSFLRELTATADVEILELGKALCLPSGVPSNPNGAPGPSIITRAAFDLLPIKEYYPVDAGLKIKPQVDNLVMLNGAKSAKGLNTGVALAPGQALELFLSGWDFGTTLGKKCANKGTYLIIGESVAGGTTTALGLLLALGIDAEEMVSSSMPGNAHLEKIKAVNDGFAAIGGSKGCFANQPLAAASALGDSMQPAVAGMALAASIYSPVMLGGGTQMAAVVALAAALRKNPPAELIAKLEMVKPENITLGTTKWVSNDPTADLAGLAANIEAKFGEFPVSYMAANLNFELSRYAALRYYEQGFVKEGVGAGAAAIAAMLGAGLTAVDLIEPIERSYERLCL